MVARRRYRAVIAGGFIAALVATGWAALANGSTDPGVWLDTPLDGAVVSGSVPLEVIGHVGGSGSIVAARLEVDGTELAEVAVDAPAGQLTTARFSWQPEAGGTYTLALWARMESGEWAGPAIAAVVVEGEAAPTPTTSTTTTTNPPSTTTCGFEPPVELDPPHGHVTPLTFTTLSWDYAGCRPALEFDVEVSTSPAFFESVASATVTESNWTTPNLGCGTWWWRVRAATFDTVGSWSNPSSFTVLNRGCP
ncbi:MAG: hypothetical protein WEE36_10240 [Acidimicrobiia bacterium]